MHVIIYMVQDENSYHFRTVSSAKTTIDSNSDNINNNIINLFVSEKVKIPQRKCIYLVPDALTHPFAFLLHFAMFFFAAFFSFSKSFQSLGLSLSLCLFVLSWGLALPSDLPCNIQLVFLQQQQSLSRGPKLVVTLIPDHLGGGSVWNCAEQLWLLELELFFSLAKVISITSKMLLLEMLRFPFQILTTFHYLRQYPNRFVRLISTDVNRLVRRAACDCCWVQKYLKAIDYHSEQRECWSVDRLRFHREKMIIEYYEHHGGGGTNIRLWMNADGYSTGLEDRVSLRKELFIAEICCTGFVWNQLVY